MNTSFKRYSIAAELLTSVVYQPYMPTEIQPRYKTPIFDPFCSHLLGTHTPSFSFSTVTLFMADENGTYRRTNENNRYYPNNPRLSAGLLYTSFLNEARWQVLLRKRYLCTTEQTVWAKAYASSLDLRLNAPPRGNQSYRTNRPGLCMSSMTAVSTKAVGFESCVYWFSMAFTTRSTVSAYEEEKCLVRSGKDIVRSGKDSMWRYLEKYVEILGKVCRDTWQSMWRYLTRYVDTVWWSIFI